MRVLLKELVTECLYSLRIRDVDSMTAGRKASSLQVLSCFIACCLRRKEETEKSDKNRGLKMPKERRRDNEKMAENATTAGGEIAEKKEKKRKERN